jgi:hypothetical protein
MTAAALPRRLWTYQAERFPVFKHGLLILVFSGGEVLYGAQLRGDGLPWPALGVAALVCFGLFLQLRIADEHKDFEDDLRFRPERPVQRGLIRLAELRMLATATAVVQAAATALFHPPLLLLLLAVWGWMALMTAEFFVPDWLKARSALYLLAHSWAMPLIALVAWPAGRAGAVAVHRLGAGRLSGAGLSQRRRAGGRAQDLGARRRTARVRDLFRLGGPGRRARGARRRPRPRGRALAPAWWRARLGFGPCAGLGVAGRALPMRARLTARQAAENARACSRSASIWAWPGSRPGAAWTRDLVAWLLAGQAARNRALCGGKAAVLAELADAFPVPPFFVLTPGAFGESGLGGEAMQALQAALSDLGPGPFAVRSSGLEEDGDAAAHAGQFETRLSVRPVEVAAAAEAVWRSGFAPDLAAYRRARGLDDAPQPPAVIVQRMLNPEAAGVAFTADPVTGDRDTTVINAVAGLADRLVSGEMNGQTYRVHATAECWSSRERSRARAWSRPGRGRPGRRAEARFGAPQDWNGRWRTAASTCFSPARSPTRPRPSIPRQRLRRPRRSACGTTLQHRGDYPVR